MKITNLNLIIISASTLLCSLLCSTAKLGASETSETIPLDSDASVQERAIAIEVDLVLDREKAEIKGLDDVDDGVARRAMIEKIVHGGVSARVSAVSDYIVEVEKSKEETLKK